MSKHTPGSWDYQQDGGCHIVAENGAWICQFWDKREEDFDNAEANARLIAAAPDLLAACEKYLAAEQWLVPGGGIPYAMLVDASRAARAAIAKVRGES